MTAVERLLQTAINEIGYLEKASNSQLDDKTANAGPNNWTKYARDLDLTKIYNGKKNGYAWCFTKGTLILTPTGYKNIEDIKTGDLVLSAFGEKFNTVTNVTSHEADVIDVSVYGAAPFTVTKDHPFLSKKFIGKEYTKCEFNKIGELGKKDIVAVPNSPVIADCSLTDDEIWVLGYYAGYGTLNENQYILHGNYKQLREIEKHAATILIDAYQLIVDGEKHQDLQSMFIECGVDATTKKIPNCILFGNKHKKRIFLEGYLCANGFSFAKKLTLCTISKEFVTGLSRVVMDVGLQCSITLIKSPALNKHENLYICHITSNTATINTFYSIEDNMTFVPIKKVGTEEYKDTVYTITTDGDHTYTANNLGVHNCDMFVDWCFIKTFGYDMALKLTCQSEGGYGAGCTGSVNYYKAKGRYFTSNPQPGDQVFFTDNGGKTFYHTGIVEKIENGRLYTIEGNNNESTRRTSYKLTYSDIGGFGRPDYSIVPNTSDQEDITVDDKTFYEHFMKMRESLQDNDSSSYSKDARAWAIKNGLIQGNGTVDSTGEPNYMWEDLLTREQFITVLYRFAQKCGLL